MDYHLSHALTSALLFLVFSSRFAVSGFRRLFGLSEDLSLIARTAVFALVILAATTI